MSYPLGAMPPARRSGGSGWKIAGFGCLALFLLAAVGMVLLGRAVKSQLAHPSKGSILGIGVLAGKAAVDGIQLRQAVVTYHQEKGRYPNSLLDLVAEGRIDGKLLHNDLDDHPSPAHLSWRYTKPAENAPGETPLLEESYQLGAGDAPPSRIVITLNGQSRTVVSRRSHAAPDQTPADQAP